MMTETHSLLASWDRHLRAANRSRATVDAYVTDARTLLTHLGAADDDALTTVSRRDVEKFLATCLDAGLAPATVARRYRSLQQLFKWLEAEGEMGGNPMAGMKPPSVPVQPPPVITAAEMKALMGACRERAGTGDNGRSGPFEARRDTAILLLLATTGIRSAELMGLKVEDVNLSAGIFTVVGKGSRIRHVELLPQPADALDRYLRLRRKHSHSASPALWLGEKGPLSDSGLRQLLERRSDAAGIRRINPHLFRHTFAHQAKLRGMPDDALMAVAGWKSNQMLQRYGASAVAERSREAHRRLFGDDRL